MIAPNMIWKANDKYGLTGEAIMAAVEGLSDPVMVPPINIARFVLSGGMAVRSTDP